MRSYLSRPLVRVVLNRHFGDIDAVAGKLPVHVFVKKKLNSMHPFCRWS